MRKNEKSDMIDFLHLAEATIYTAENPGVAQNAT